MAQSLDLRSEAYRYTNELTALLTRTVCEGVRLTAVLWDWPHPRAMVGYKITREDSRSAALPLKVDRGRPQIYLGYSCRLQADPEGDYLMVESSVMSLATSDDLKCELLHYDYEREKGDGYPEAHLQVCATSPAWDEVCQWLGPGSKGRHLERLHLPVGPRRFRPTLEDLLEFAIREGLVCGRDGWHDALEETREQFRVRQLRAAIRRDPETALAVLRESNHV